MTEATPKQIPHLRVCSSYSLRKGLASPAEIVQQAAKLSVPAVALTDTGNMSGAVKFYKSALALGVQPIIGVEAKLLLNSYDAPSDLVLLCLTEQGYHNLLRLVSRAHSEMREKDEPALAMSWLKPERLSGLAALSGGAEGGVGQALLRRDAKGARRLAEELRTSFDGNFYLEIHRLGRLNDEACLEQSVDLSAKTDIPLVASGDVCFLSPAHYRSYNARVGIATGRTINKIPSDESSEQQWLVDAGEMGNRFADLPIALENACALARRCGNVLNFPEPATPVFPVAKGTTPDDYLRECANQGLRTHLGEEEIPQPYQERLDMELDIIMEMGFSSYFLIVMDFIRWARENDISVGPGRGSGAGSLVAWVLNITEPDPMKFGLLFERFLNPERVSLPDFDIDFCPSGRDRVIAYVSERYGKESVAQIATFGTMAAKAAVRDSTRVLGYRPGLGDRIAREIPVDASITLDSALEQSPALREMAEGGDERAILDLAKSLEGCIRNVGRHAGGVVIAPGDITDRVPLYQDPHDSQVRYTQYDKDDVEAVGLIKFDFLGLSALTVLDKAMDGVNSARQAKGEEPIDLLQVAMDDPQVFALFKQGSCTGIFQLESQRMLPLIQQFAPQNMEELCALLALIRPGPLESRMYHQSVDVKHGKAEMELAHPSLKDVLEPTWGVFVYQEQVMEAARVLAGYSYGEADELRRVMGKKNREAMANLEESFVERASAREIEPKLAKSIFDDISKFAGYGFNKSHSVVYAFLAYRTAWLKRYHPAHLLASMISIEAGSHNRVRVMLDECQRLGIQVRNPHINHSKWDSFATSESEVQLGMSIIKGLGVEVARRIVEERASGGEYSGLFEFCHRIGGAHIGGQALSGLIHAGSLDGLIPNRLSAYSIAGTALQASTMRNRQSEVGQKDLFAVADTSEAEGIEKLGHPTCPALLEYPFSDLAKRELATFGFYFRHHPMQAWKGDIEQLGAKPFDKIFSMRVTENTPLFYIGGMVRNPGFLERPGRTGRKKQKLWTALLEDHLGRRVELRKYLKADEDTEFLPKHQDLIMSQIQARQGREDGRVSYQMEKFWALAPLRDLRALSMDVQLSTENSDSLTSLASRQVIDVLQKCLTASGNCALQVNITTPCGMTGDILLADGESRRVRCSEESVDALRSNPCVKSIYFRYNH